MPSIGGRLLALLLTGPALAACQVGTPPVDPAQVGLQRGDVPADLARCPNSGPVDTYMKRLSAKDPEGHATLQQGWRRLRSAGAVEGVMTVYAAAPGDCLKEPGAGAGRLVATLVTRFDSDQAAAAAYPKGAMGFPTPGQDQEEPGLQQGVATQLSPNSWLLQREVGTQALEVAYWQRGTCTIYFVSLDLDTVEASRAFTAVDGRSD